MRKRRQNQQLRPRGPVEAGVKQGYSETQHSYIVFAGQGQQRGRSERRHSIGMDSHSSAGKSWGLRNQNLNSFKALASASASAWPCPVRSWTRTFDLSSGSLRKFWVSLAPHSLLQARLASDSAYSSWSSCLCLPIPFFS